MLSNTVILSQCTGDAAPPGFPFFRVMGPVLRCHGGQLPPWHIPALLRLLVGVVLAISLQGSIDSVFVERGRFPRAPGEKPAVHRDRTPTPPDITPGIIARGHARPAPGVPHTVRTPLRVFPDGGCITQCGPICGYKDL